MDDFDTQLQKRQEYARSLGWSEDDILKGTAVEQEKMRQETTSTITPPASQKTTITDTGTDNKPSTVTGHTIIEHQKALQKARSLGLTDAMKIIQSDYDKEYQYQKDFGTNKKETEAKAFKDDVIGIAQQLQGVIENKDSYDEKTYKDTVNSLASSLILKKKEAENLGAALSGIELSILSGQTPVVKTIGASVGSKIKQAITGEMPVQRGEVVEDEATLSNKLTLLIAGMQGVPVSPEMFSPEVGKEVTKLQDQEAEQLNVNVIENALNEVVGFATAIPDLGKLVLGLTPPGQMVRKLQGADVGQEDYEMLKGFLGGLMEDVSKTTGISIDPSNKEKPVTFDPQAALVHDWNHPLSTLAYVVSFLQVAKMAKGAKAIKAGEVATTFPKTPPTTPQTIGRLRGQTLTSVAAPVADSVTKSEALMKDVYQMTKSVTPRGIAKELEAFTPKVGKDISAYSKSLDKIVGAQPVDEVVAQIVEGIKQTSSVAQTNPEMVTTIERILANKLRIGEVPGGLVRGEAFGTNMERMNEARKFLNNSISRNWFENGQPTTSAADQLNALKWDASNGLKDIMIEADSSGGYFQKAINLQHSALSTAPVLSRISLTGSPSWAPQSALFRGLTKTLDVPKTIMGRMAAGEAEPLTKSILGGRVPEVTPFVPSGQPINVVPKTPQTLIPAATKPIKAEVPQTPAGFKEGEYISGTKLVPAKKGGWKPATKIPKKKSEITPVPKTPQELNVAQQPVSDVGKLSQPQTGGKLVTQAEKLKELKFDPSRLEKNVRGPRTAGNFSDKWEAQIRYKGFAADKRAFNTKAEAQKFLDTYKFEGMNKSVLEDYYGSMFGGGIKRERIYPLSSPQTGGVGAKTLPIKQLLDIEGDSIKTTTSKISKGELSVTKGPIDVIKTDSGYVVLDGQHRAAEALKLGRENISANILSKEEAIKKYGDRWPQLEGILPQTEGVGKKIRFDIPKLSDDVKKSFDDVGKQMAIDMGDKTAPANMTKMLNYLENYRNINNATDVEVRGLLQQTKKLAEKIIKEDDLFKRQDTIPAQQIFKKTIKDINNATLSKERIDAVVAIDSFVNSIHQDYPLSLLPRAFGVSDPLTASESVGKFLEFTAGGDWEKTKAFKNINRITPVPKTPAGSIIELNKRKTGTPKQTGKSLSEIKRMRELLEATSD